MTKLDGPEHYAADSAEREDGRLELVATVLLGLGAVLIAWGTYQSAWYDGQKGTELTNSVLATTQSVDAFQVADTTRALDQILFVEMLASGVCSDSGQRAVCEQFTNTLSNEGREEVAAWLSGDVSSIFNAKRRYQRGGDDLIADSQQYFENALQADDTSSSYSQAVALVSISLFFAGISLVISRTNARKGLLVLATLFVVGPLAFMATLPIA